MNLAQIKKQLESIKETDDFPADQAMEYAASLLRSAYEIAPQGIDWRHVKQFCSPSQAICEVNRIIAATQPIEPQEFLNVAQAAKLLGVNASKVLSWIRSGKLPAIDSATGTRSAYRIRKCDLDALATTATPARSRRAKQPDNLIDFL